MMKVRITLVLALTLIAAGGGAAVAQLQAEDACLDAGNNVVGGHDTCANAAGEEWPLRAPYASFASLGALMVIGPWGIRRAWRATRQKGPEHH